MRTIRSAFPLALLFFLASTVSRAQNNCLKDLDTQEPCPAMVQA
jgi:hypothetical protein